MKRMNVQNGYLGFPSEHSLLRKCAAQMRRPNESISAALRRLHEKYAIATRHNMAVGFQSHEMCYGMRLIRLNGMIIQDNDRFTSQFLAEGEQLAMKHHKIA